MLPTPRRRFVDVPGGQVHYRDAGAGGTPLVLLHPSPGSGKMLVPLLREMGATRRTIALDTRGNGDSTPLDLADPRIEDLAAAALEALHGLGIGSFDLYGSHTGASIAMEVSILAPGRVRRLILDSMGLWSPEWRDDYLARNSPQITPDLMGSQFNWAFHYVRDQFLFWPWYERTAAARRPGGLPAPEVLHDMVIEVLKSIDTYHLSYRAAARHPKRNRLKLITVPTLAASWPGDMLFQFLDEMASLIPGAERAVSADPETPEGAAVAAAVYTAFLDKP